MYVPLFTTIQAVVSSINGSGDELSYAEYKAELLNLQRKFNEWKPSYSEQLKEYEDNLHKALGALLKSLCGPN